MEKEKNVKTQKTAPVKKTDKRKRVGKVLQKVKSQVKDKKPNVSSDKLELVVLIVSRRKAEFFQDLLGFFEANLALTVRARGTAQPNVLKFLGIEDNEKAAVFAVLREDKVEDALSTVEHKFKTTKGGGGVAFSVPLSSVIGVMSYGFLSNNPKLIKEEKK